MEGACVVPVIRQQPKLLFQKKNTKKKCWKNLKLQFSGMSSEVYFLQLHSSAPPKLLSSKFMIRCVEFSPDIKQINENKVPESIEYFNAAKWLFDALVNFSRCKNTQITLTARELITLLRLLSFILRL